MAVRKRFPSASVKEHEIEFPSFNRFQHVVSLFFRLKFVNKVIAIRTNFLQSKIHRRLRTRIGFGLQHFCSANDE